MPNLVPWDNDGTALPALSQLPQEAAAPAPQSPALSSLYGDADAPYPGYYQQPGAMNQVTVDPTATNDLNQMSKDILNPQSALGQQAQALPLWAVNHPPAAHPAHPALHPC